LRAEPLVDPVFHIVLPLLLFEDLTPFGFPDEGMKVDEAMSALREIWSDHRLINVQVGCEQFTGFIVDWQFEPHHLMESKDCFQGTFIAKVKVI
jgi:hypothetical protein